MLEWWSKQEVYGEATTTETHQRTTSSEDKPEAESKT